MSDRHMIISIGRQCGSGGHEIGKKLAEHYGIAFYDQNIIQMLADEMHVTAEEVEKLDEKLGSSFLIRRGGFEAKQKDLMNRMSRSDQVFLHESALLERMAETESFVIIGRGANVILAENPDTLRLYIYAPEAFRIARTRETYELDSDKDAQKMMEQIDKTRRQYFEFYTGRTWGDADHHDLMIDSSLLGIDGTTELIISVADKKFGIRN